MITNFKNFNESSSDNDGKMIAVTEQFYIDLSDIFLDLNGFEYNVRLIKTKAGLKVFYIINIVVENFEDINSNKSVRDKFNKLKIEFIDYYSEEYNLDVKASLAPYSYSKSQEILFKKGSESFDNIEKTNYLNKVKKALEVFKNSYDELNTLWSEDHNYDLDLNDFLTDDYPFEHSFDEINISDWVDNSISDINDNLGISE